VSASVSERVRTFRSRFALEQLDDGGVLLAFETGSYFQLNRSAARTCAILEASEGEEDALARLVESLGIPPADAGAALTQVLAELDRVGEKSVPRSPFRYERAEAGYHLVEDGRPILEIATSTRRLRLCVAAASLRYPLIEYVRTVTPRLLGLLGVSVLHGSLCRGPAGAIAFSGESTAGKTTTARAFGAAGAAVISEDLVVLTPDETRASCWANGETSARGWGVRAAEALLGDEQAALPYEELEAVAQGPAQEIDQVWFLASTRRRGTDFAREPLGPSRGMVSLLENVFIADADFDVWRRHLRALRRLAEHLQMFEVTAPAGLPALARAARAYVTSSASYVTNSAS
jgi:hypothetical protein